MVKLQQNFSEGSQVFQSIVPIKRDLIIFIFYCVDAFDREDLEQIVEKIGERGRNQQEPDLFTLHKNELSKRIEEQQKNRQNYQKLQVMIKQRKQQDSDSVDSFQTITNDNNSNSNSNDNNSNNNNNSNSSSIPQQKLSIEEQYQRQNNSNSGG